MTDAGESQFQKGQPVWVIDQDGSELAAEYVGEGGTSSWLGGKTRVIVVYLETGTADTVEADRVIPRGA